MMRLEKEKLNHPSEKEKRKKKKRKRHVLCWVVNYLCVCVRCVRSLFEKEMDLNHALFTLEITR